MKYTHILWDWNGTLIDDLGVSVEVLNAMLSPRGLKTLTHEEYREVFRFPIIDYYIAVGLTPERWPYDDLAKEYWQLYDPASRTAPLMAGAKEVLQQLKDLGAAQAILSASEQGHLKAVTKYFGIHGYFNDVLGLNSIHAHSKVELGLDWIRREGVAPEHVVLIGDTEHDAAVAKSMGIDCILIPKGHYSRRRLELLDLPIVEDISLIPQFLSKLPE